LPLVVVGVAIAAAMALPLVYLGVRASGIGEGLPALLTSVRTISILVNSTLLAIIVTALCAVIAVVAAFLTVRTDLPARKVWSIFLILPLSIPSFVGSFAIIATFAPRGSALQSLLAPLGVDTLPSIYGWPGAILSLTLFSYPYIFLTARFSNSLIYIQGRGIHGSKS